MRGLWLAYVIVFITYTAHVVVARPCPPTAVFMRSEYHSGAAFCVCAPGAACTGALCEYGGVGNSPSFGSADVGFPLNCTHCR